MSHNFYAVFMGFNDYDDKDHFERLQYAEKDAQDLCDLLINPEISKFKRENVALIPNNATNDSIEEVLYKYVVQGRVKDDVVIIFFSGHSFKSWENDKVFLATPHTQ